MPGTEPSARRAADPRTSEGEEGRREGKEGGGEEEGGGGRREEEGAPLVFLAHVEGMGATAHGQKACTAHLHTVQFLASPGRVLLNYRHKLLFHHLQGWVVWT